MYQPIPGSSQLLRFQSEVPVVYPAPSSNMDTEQLALTGQLVRIALDVASGLRPITHLSPSKFDPSISMHLSAWTRRHGTRSRLWMKSLHGRKDGEYFGTAILGERKIAFTGRYAIAQKKLRAFRLL